MSDGSLVHLLHNVSVRRIVSALERDGFRYRSGQGSQRIYRHPDRRRVIIHYHKGSDTLPSYILRNLLNGTRWTEEDLRRLRLIR